jgi:hypothetical protein
LNILVQREDLLAEMGYKQPPQPKLLKMVDEVLGLLGDLLEPNLAFGEILDENSLPPFLLGAALKYVGAATLGPKLETKVKELFDERKPAESYILDTAGSIAITQAGDVLWRRIRQDAASKGFKKGLRRTPGCAGIEIETQHWILEKLADAEPGIALTEAWMMVPRKSLSFLARFGGKLKGTFSCEGCPQYAECTLRSEKE